MLFSLVLTIPKRVRNKLQHKNFTLGPHNIIGKTIVHGWASTTFFFSMGTFTNIIFKGYSQEMYLVGDSYEAFLHV